MDEENKKKREEIKKETDEQVKEIWERIEASAQVSQQKLYSLCVKSGISPTSVYDSINATKLNRPIKRTDAYTIVQLAEQLNVPLNYVIHGEKKYDSANKEQEESNKSVAESIFALSKGDLSTLLLLAIPYLTPEQVEAIRADVISRFKF